MATARQVYTTKARMPVAAQMPFQPAAFWVSRVDARRADRFPLHLHAHYELILPERGLYRCRVAGEVVSAMPGEAVLVCPGDSHEDPLSGPVAYLGCGFRLEPSPDAERSPVIFSTAAPVTARHVASHATLTRLLAQVREAYDGEPDSFAWAALDATCAQWLWEHLKQLAPAWRAPVLRPPNAEAHGADLAVRLRASLGHLLAEPVPVAVLATRAGLTPRAFATACRATLGLTPQAARRRLRCEAAAALLAAGHAVGDTAERLGFANPFHFSRAFRQAMGRPPSAYRR